MDTGPNPLGNETVALRAGIRHLGGMQPGIRVTRRQCGMWVVAVSTDSRNQESRVFQSPSMDALQVAGLMVGMTLAAEFHLAMDVKRRTGCFV